MPPWLSTVPHVNPLSYEVDALRDLMLVSGAATGVLTSIAARMYRRMGY
jgi:hypothetical protein